MIEDAVEEFETVELQMTEVNEIVELSMNSVFDLSIPGTVKLKGRLGNRDVVVLIG